MRLRDRVAIVTGAARGIGQAYCMALAAEGAKVVAADILSCETTVSRIQDTGGEALHLITDVASAEDTRAMAGQTIQKFGRIDVLVNNAAVYGDLKMTPFDQISEAEWDRVMAVNVKGMWQCSKAVIPAMRERGKGKIINISSATIWYGIPLLLHYVTSKGAVIALTRALARELSGTGINVNAVTPGFTMTDASKELAATATSVDARQRALDRQIIKRSEEETDVTGTVVFLASDDSDFIAGQTINVDGGGAHH